jgi:molybdate transport system ATP-binding protein
LLRAEARTELLDAAIDVAAGRCLALVGPSGAGKTTLLRIVAGLQRPRDGRVTCGDDTWLDTRAGIDLAPERRRCGMVFQDYALFGHLDALGNVAYGVRDRDVAREWLERLGVAHAASRRPAQLSGGERQRVALARALAPRPGVVLLDEPLAALDPLTRGEAGAVLRAALAATDAPAVLVTHDFAEAALIADEIAVLEAGRVTQRGTPGELAARPASVAVAALTGAVVLAGTARPAGGLTAVDLGGEVISSADLLEGPVAATLFPWEIALEPPGPARGDSARNHLAATVTSLTPLGNRVRVGLELSGGRPLAAEVTAQAAADLELAPGRPVVAAFKATATRLVAR